MPNYLDLTKKYGWDPKQWAGSAPEYISDPGRYGDYGNVFSQPSFKEDVSKGITGELSSQFGYDEPTSKSIFGILQPKFSGRGSGADVLRGEYRGSSLAKDFQGKGVGFGSTYDVDKYFGGIKQLGEYLAGGGQVKEITAPASEYGKGGNQILVKAEGQAVPEGTASRSTVVQTYLENFGREPTPEELEQHIGKTGTEHLLQWAPQRAAEMEQEALQKEVLGDEDPIVGDNTDPNQQEIDDAEAKKKEDELKAINDAIAERDGLSVESEIQDYKDKLGISDKPDAPTLLDDYEAMRDESGVPALEGRLNQLNKDIADAEASVKSGLYDVEGKLKPMELIGTEQRELARQGQELLDTLNRSKQTIVDELNTKNTLISNLMNLTQQDYQNASTAYNQSFNQNIQLLEMIKGDKADDRDFAQANLSTITSVLSETNKSWGDLDTSLQATIYKLEVQSGLPVGMTRAIYDSADATKEIKNVHYSSDDTQGSILYTDGSVESFSTGITADAGDGGWPTGTPTSYKEWSMAGKPGSYESWVNEDTSTEDRDVDFEKYTKGLVTDVYAKKITREQAKAQIRTFYPDYDENVIYDLIPDELDPNK